MFELIKKLDSTNTPILVDNLIPLEENKNILHILSFQRDWRFGSEGQFNNGPLFDIAYSNNFPHLGMTLTSADKEHTDFNNHPLNIYARLIANILSHKLNFKFNTIQRVHWNYYYKGQEGIGHVDSETKNNISIVYNMKNSDGGTEILSKFYPDIEGQAKVFKSEWFHRGVSTKLDKSRLSLNIVLG